MNRSLLAVSAVAAIALAGCAGTQTAAPDTVTSISTVTVTNATTVTEQAAPTVEHAIEMKSPEDQAACRLIAPAIAQSGLQQLADQQMVGGGVLYGDVVIAGRDFVNMLGTAPTSASDSITGPLLALVTDLSTLEQNWTALPKDADVDAINSALASFPQSVGALDDVCPA